MNADSALERVIAAAEARHLPALIAEWSGAPDARRSIAIALRIDLALLVGRPDLAVPCVVRRCAWLSAWLDGRRALRSLLPPAVPIDGGVIEEYRTDAKGELWLSPDGSRIGVASAGDGIVWDRASGERVRDERAGTALLVPPVPPRWRLDREKAEWGRGSLISVATGKRWTFEHSREERACGLHELAPDRAHARELALLACEGSDPYACGDDEPAYHLADLTRQRLLWRAPGSFETAQIAGDLLFVKGHGGDLTAHVLATGERVGVWRLMPGDVAFAARPGPSLGVATRTESVIRVWDLSRVPRDFTPAAGARAELSPDGTRLLLGDRISDARTGRPIGRVELHGVGSWLEGGPPADCRRLCNGVFMEITPMGFYAWETATGTRLVEDRARRAEILDAVCFDPAGRFHAVWPGRARPEGPNPLRVHSVIDGAIVFERPVALRRAEDSHLRYRLGFSPGGGELWWETTGGERCVLTIGTGVVRTLPARETLPVEPPPARATVLDGLLLAGDLALPIDTNEVLATHDGACFAGANAHYVVATT